MLLTKGKVEAYAVTKSKEDFRQEYLVTLPPGEAVFPAWDEFGKIDILIYIAAPSELEEISLRGAEPERLRPLMENWLKRTLEAPCMEALLSKGDDVLKSWEKGTALTACRSLTELVEEFKDNQSIFAMLEGNDFKAREKLLARRLEHLAEKKKFLLDASIGELLDDGDSFFDLAEGEANSQTEETAFVVRCARKALAMSEESLYLPPEIIRKLDPVGLLRRLAQKGNMQLRLVTLTGEWYQKDTGVLIGFLQPEGEARGPVAILPETPHSYRLVSRKHPEGLPLTESLAKALEKDAFQCYAGFPRRRLKIVDLLKFMFHQCWKNDYRTLIAVSFFAGFIPLVTPVITETIFRDILPILDRKGLVTVTQVMIVTSFTMAALSTIRSVAIMRISSRLDMSVEAALWGRLLALPEKFFRRFTSGELAHRMQGMEAVKSVIGGNFVPAVFNTIFSFWSLLLMCWYSLKLTAAAMAVWLVWCLVTAFIYRRVIVFQRNLIAANNKEAGLVQQLFTGLAKFRVRGSEEQAYHLWSKVFGETWKWNLALRWQGNLVFDEATSALDNKAQAIVTESIDKLAVTRIVIAHRLSTIRKCDRILVMDKGTVAESGTFEELVKQDGIFAKLVKRQVA